jgi:phosphoglycolate phosphatase
MRGRFTLLVFDWDGTLMDSEARIVQCVQAAAADLALAIPESDAVRNIIGLGLTEAVTTLFPGSDGHQVNAVVARYRHHFLGNNPTPSPLFPGVEETLQQLEQAGYLLAVATGKGRAGLERVLQDTGLAGHFHATRCADETFSKPHPEMLLQLMDQMGVTARETLMIGDTEWDMQMARNAGAACMAVSYGAHPLARLLQHEPLGCLDRISELADWLQAWESKALPVREPDPAE